MDLRSKIEQRLEKGIYNAYDDIMPRYFFLGADKTSVKQFFGKHISDRCVFRVVNMLGYRCEYRYIDKVKYFVIGRVYEVNNKRDIKSI